MSNNFDDILKSFGYTKCKKRKNEDYENTDKDNCSTNFNYKNIENKCKNINSDILFGFQDIDPMLLLVLSELLSNAISGDLPASLLNAYGNWLQLVGQVIETFNAQQQYSESGPGLYYSPENRNIFNPYCPNSYPDNGVEDRGSKYKKRKKSSKKKDNDEIQELKKEITILKKEIKELKEQVSLKN